jgi:SAM-dependent methyltransferase
MALFPITNLAKYLRRGLLLNSSRVHLYRVNADFAATMKTGKIMLDAGAGDAPYKHLFSHVRYESADFEQVTKAYAKSTYVCNLCERIPVEDARYDYVLFNQTMEHLDRPEKALFELHRVLKCGGKLLCTAPLFYEEHELPYDFFRYTQFAHRRLFVEAGFQVDRIEWLEGFFGTCGYMLQTIHYNIPSRIEGGASAFFLAPFLLLTRTVALIAAAIFYRLDLRWKISNAGFPKNYVVMATKPITE